MSLGSLDVNDAMLKSAKAKQFDLVFYFISLGADINFSRKNSCDESVLQMAVKAKTGELECIQDMAAAGADIDENEFGYGALCSALTSRRVDIAKYLMSLKATCS